MYNKVNSEDLIKLKDIAGEQNVIVGDDIALDYAHDELGGVERMPEVLIRVHTTEETRIPINKTKTVNCLNNCDFNIFIGIFSFYISFLFFTIVQHLN